jgi:hypothetical protein
MIMTYVRVGGVGSFGGGKLLRSGGLGLRVEVFDFGFAKDAVACCQDPWCERRIRKTYIQVLLVGER